MLSFFGKLSAQRVNILLFSAITVAVFGLYGPSLYNGFAYDDEVQIVDNPQVKSLSNVPAAFTSCIWEAHMPACKDFAHYYRPTQTLSYIFTYVFSANPWLFHLVNLLYYIALNFVIFLFLSSMLERKAAILMSLFLFIFHPIHSEVVMWASAVPELLLAIFVALALWIYVKGNRNKIWISAIFYFCALLSKETAVALPVLFILYDYLFKHISITRAYLKNFLPHIAALTLYSLMRILVIGLYSKITLPVSVTLSEKIYNFPYVFGEYIKKTIFPIALNPHIPYEPISGLADPRLLVGLIFVFVFISAVALAAAKRYKILLFGLSFYFVFLLPALIFSAQRLLIGERYLFLPSLGVLLIAGFYWDKLFQVSRPYYRPAILLGTIVLFFIGGIRVYAQNKVWRSSRTLYEYVHEQNVIRGYSTDEMYYNLAVIYANEGDKETARKIYEEIIANTRRISTSKEKAYNDLGNMYLEDGDADRASQLFQALLMLNPRYSTAHFGLARAYAEKRMYVNAIEHAIQTIIIAPQRDDAFELLNSVYKDVAYLPRYGESGLQSVFRSLSANTIWKKWDFKRSEQQLSARSGMSAKEYIFGATYSKRNNFMQVILDADPEIRKVILPSMIFYTDGGNSPKLLREGSVKFSEDGLKSKIMLEIPLATVSTSDSGLELYLILNDFRYYKIIIKSDS